MLAAAASAIGRLLAVGFLVLGPLHASGLSLLRPAASATISDAAEPRTTVWLSAFARSGSSTLFALIENAAKSRESGVSLAQSGNRAPASLFEIFEPCHYKNQLEPWLQEQGCDGLMKQVLDCNFKGIGSLRFDLPDDAETACKSASLVLYKTVNLTQTIPLLDSMKASSRLLPDVLQDAGSRNVRVVELVRDPRGIYASWVGTREFRGNVVREPATLTQICDAFAATLNVSHANFHRVVYEDLVRQPKAIAKSLLADFLGLPYGHSQEGWIDRHFDADCGYTSGGRYRTCQQDSESHIEAWRDVLNKGEMNAFLRHSACRDVAEANGYALEDAEERKGSV